jgi:hypothetical protein
MVMAAGALARLSAAMTVMRVLARHEESPLIDWLGKA